MAEVATAPTIEINFDAIAGKPTTPPSSTQVVLSSIKTGGDLKTFSARSRLSAKQLEYVHARARELYPQMIDDRGVLTNFGIPELDGVNAVVGEMLKALGRAKIPEIKSYLRDMEKAADGFRRRWSGNPDLEQALEKWIDTLAGVFNFGRDVVERMYRDSLTTVERLDKVAGKFEKDRIRIDQDVIDLGKLYRASVASLGQLIGVIAILEEEKDVSVEELTRLEAEIKALPEGSLERDEKLRRQSLVTQFAKQVEVQLNEFIQQYFLAGSTSEQVNTMQSVGVGFSQRLTLLVKVTINSSMKKEIVQLGILLGMQKTAEAIDEIDAAHNRALQNLAKTTATVVVGVEQTIQRPSVSPETLIAISDSIVTQNQGLVEAFKLGQQQRAAVVDAVVRGSAAITASAQERDKVILELITQASKPVEFVAAPIVPDAVQKDAQLLAITA